MYESRSFSGKRRRVTGYLVTGYSKFWGEFTRWGGVYVGIKGVFKHVTVESSILTINRFLQISPSCEANSYGIVQNISSFSGDPKAHSHFVIDRISHFTLYCIPLVLKEELFSWEIFIKPSCLANMPPSTEQWQVGELLLQTYEWSVNIHFIPRVTNVTSYPKNNFCFYSCVNVTNSDMQFYTLYVT